MRCKTFFCLAAIGMVFLALLLDTSAEEEEHEMTEEQQKAFEALQEKRRLEPPAKAVRTMVATERKFYETGQEKGTRAAFLAFLADNAIVFRPGPINGKEVWSKREESGFDLVWEPSFAAIARSADFGYDTGPSKWRASKKEKQFAGYGHFVSIWRRQMDGSWKVELDCGIEHPKPTGKTESLRTVVPPPEKSGQPDMTARQHGFRDAQTGFVSLAKLDFTKAFREFADDRVRLYRDGSLPAVGKVAAAKLLGPEQAGVTMEIIVGDTSSTVDLAYYYGKYSDTRVQSAKNGHFLQIWQVNASGAWKLVLDWQQKLPEQK